MWTMDAAKASGRRPGHGRLSPSFVVGFRGIRDPLLVHFRATRKTLVFLVPTVPLGVYTTLSRERWSVAALPCGFVSAAATN